MNTAASMRHMMMRRMVRLLLLLSLFVLPLLDVLL